VIELRFLEELYDGFAVDEAAKAYAEYADVEAERSDGAFVLRVTARQLALDEGIDEATLSAELANHALGATIDRGEAAS
jgi:hypothetical protein